MKTTSLRERLANDRSKMASAVEQIVTECGANFTREQGGEYPGAQAIYLFVTAAGGLNVTVEFDGKSPQPDVYVLSWHMNHSGAKRRLNNETFGGDVNPHHFHFHKATYVAYGFEDLCAQFKSGLLMAKDGTAFLPEALAA